MRSLRHRLPETRRGVVVAAYLAAALVLGGGGSPSAIAEVLVQLAFAGAVLAWAWWAQPAAPADAYVPRSLVVLAGAILALPLVHLIPLPPALWQALPARELTRDALGIVGAADAWRPLSIAPFATLGSLLAVVPAVGIMIATATLSTRDRRFLLLTIAALALAGAALGVLQMASGPGRFRLYEISHDTWLTAFYANRNAAVDFLLIGMLALTAWVAGIARRRPLLKGDVGFATILQLFLLAAVVLTGSRTGIALLPVVLLVQFAILRSGGAARKLSTAFALLAGAIATMSLVAIVSSGNARLSTLLERFDAGRDTRVDLWQDALSASAAYWPFGSGLGSFTRAFLPFERFSTMDELFPNRAHNDYLEFLIEAGLPGTGVLLCAAVAVFLLMRGAWFASPEQRSQTLFAAGVLLVIALHSVVDYPLRTMALASLAGVAVGLLGALARGEAPGRTMDGTA